MRNILVVADPHNPARTRSAVEQAVRLHRDEPVGIRLVRVQPRLSAHVAMCFPKGELQQLQKQAGQEDLAYARSLLDLAGVPYESAVLTGRSADTIARAAREFGCSRILLGDVPKGLTARVFGSVAEQVRHLLGPGGHEVIGS